MNTLPIVSIFLIILATLTVSFFHGHQTFEAEVKGLQAFWEAETSALNQISEIAYERVPKLKMKTESKDASPTEKTEKEQKIFLNPHRMKHIPEEGKFPLLKILNKENVNPALEHAGKTLLEALYKNAPFYTPSFEKDVLKSLKKATEEVDAVSFIALIPAIKEQQDLFYKLLRGTKNYDSESGYPPLSDFFTLSEHTRIFFALTSTPILEAFFGKEMTQTILNEEDKQEKILLKKDFQKMFQEFQTKNSLSPTLPDYFTFFKKNRAKSLEVVYGEKERFPMQILKRIPNQEIK